jgi:hypothetical protein
VISSFLRRPAVRYVEEVFDEAVSLAQARRGLGATIADHGSAYPFRDGDDRTRPRRPHGRSALPSQDRERIRTTNLLEHTFVEVRRRTKVIGRFPGETSALSLLWAVLELSSRGWRCVILTPNTVAEIERLRRTTATRGRPATRT